jgi:hypothetical protein
MERDVFKIRQRTINPSAWLAHTTAALRNADPFVSPSTMWEFFVLVMIRQQRQPDLL